ncbi:MAG: ATP-binding cassette domain-containing protein [Desulfomonilaceae bacterium]
MLEISNLMVFYENALALNDFSMKVDPGSIVAVIGSNSAGKTTLMNTISGLIIDTKIKEQRKGGERITLYGTVKFEGEDITNMYPSDRVERGMVLCRERHPIFPESDLVENLKIAGYLRKRSDVKKTIDYVFHLFPTLVRLKTRKGGFLSGGEQQMLTIGMALMAKPKLLLLDEPLLGLSPVMQTALVDAIKTIRAETGLTIVISEQFARPILPMIDHGHILENGMLTMEGSGPELMDNPEVKAAYFGV